ncbi:MAG: DUF6807 domain-containing protein, partial [Planctomycetota bacterium]
TQLEDRVRVEIRGELFTEYIFSGYAKPLMYPLIGPGGVEMMRHFPMKEGVKGEANDHVHQKSLWYTHGDVNGVDFWAEAASGRAANVNIGTIVQNKITRLTSGTRGTLRTENQWVDEDGRVLLTDTRQINFVSPGKSPDRYIDFRITLHASHGDVTFGDTKEGTMGIRTHPNLRLKNDPKHAQNSEGDKDADLWGKRTAWVDYWGEIDNKTVGIAIFDHPTNPRHPTWWHARDYGLIAANPFGLSYFEGKERGTGDFKIANGESVTFRYRFLFHENGAEAANIAKRYDNFGAPKGPEAE